MKKKNFLRVFNKKNTVIGWTRLKTKAFSTCQPTYQKELYLLFENADNFFSQNERTDRLDHFLRTSSPLPLLPPSLHDRCTFLNDPVEYGICIVFRIGEVCLVWLESVLAEYAV